MTTTPLTVLDLVPISSGSTAAQALRNSIDLAQQAERLGYARYWFAEHHLNPGVAGTSPGRGARADRRRHVDDPARLRARCRWGTAPRCRPSRSSACSTPCTRAASTSASAAPAAGPREPKAPALAGGAASAAVADGRTPNGLLIPPRFSFAAPARLAPVRAAEDAAPAAARGAAELHRAGRRRARADRRHLPLAGRRGGARGARRGRGAAGLDPRQQRRRERRGGRRRGPAVRRELPRQPGHRARGGGRLPGRVPALGRARPALRQRVGRRRRRRAPRPRPASWPPATACGCAASAPPRAPSSSPPPSRPAATSGRDADRDLVADRVDTQFVGTPGQVADQLERLRDATEADELIITTITHDHADRVRSYQLLAEEWARR